MYLRSVGAAELATLPDNARITVLAGPMTPRIWNSSLFARYHTGLNGSLNSSSLLLPNGSFIPGMAARPGPEVWEIKQAIADAVEEGIRKAKEEAAQNGTAPSVEALKRAVNEEMWGKWQSLMKPMRASRFQRHPRGLPPREGFLAFFWSVSYFDWGILVVAILLFTMQHYGLLHWPRTLLSYSTALALWFAMAGLFALVVFRRQGADAGMLWLNGYVLEIIFLVQNVLVSHIIIQAFRTPRWVNEKALFIVVIARIVFQMIFYMGLAELVFSGEALPYILGVWLLYVAYQAAMEDEGAAFDIMETRVVHVARAVFGDRLWLAKDESGAMFVTKDQKRRLSVIGLMVFCLILVDALLHVDVALTKIEELQGNGYLCFSSAAVASFCLPELVFVTRDLFRRFPGLKYGISLEMAYISVQMLLHQVFNPPVVLDLVVFVSLLLLSALLPRILRGSGLQAPGLNTATVDQGTQADGPHGPEGGEEAPLALGGQAPMRRGARRSERSSSPSALPPAAEGGGRMRSTGVGPG